MGVYLILLAEQPLKDLMSIEYLPYLHTQATSSFILHRLRDLLQEFGDCFQMACCKNRKDMIQLILNIFSIGDLAKQIEIQYYHDKNLI